MKWASQLISTIDGIIDNINNIDGISPALRAIGVRASVIGATDVHFEVLGSCLIELVQDMNEASWSGRFEAAWTCGVEAIVAIIMPAIEQANRERAVIVKVGCRQMHLAPLLFKCLCVAIENSMKSTRCKRLGKRLSHTRRHTEPSF